ncbi:hypothetical protein [Hungatella effluvii]|uniref:hypothetical protein n=1 Tax=Hungatella effluvii TaxID=1096246 RepID=UPI002A7FB307|nr:hypothetical protein [Hungatella effluvii]
MDTVDGLFFLSESVAETVLRMLRGEEMDSSHEMIIPNDNLPFKLFLFEGGEGKYKRASHWHRSIEIFLVMEGKIDFYLGENHFTI